MQGPVSPARSNPIPKRSGGKAEKNPLLSGDVCGENKRELESHAADLLGSGLGIDSRAEPEGHDADPGLSALGFAGCDGHVELNELQGCGSREAFTSTNGKSIRAFVKANGWRTDAGNFFRCVGDAFVNFGQGFGNKLAEVHG